MKGSCKWLCRRGKQQNARRPWASCPPTSTRNAVDNNNSTTWSRTRHTQRFETTASMFSTKTMRMCLTRWAALTRSSGAHGASSTSGALRVLLCASVGVSHPPHCFRCHNQPNLCTMVMMVQCSTIRLHIHSLQHLAQVVVNTYGICIASHTLPLECQHRHKAEHELLFLLFDTRRQPISIYRPPPTQSPCSNEQVNKKPNHLHWYHTLELLPLPPQRFYTLARIVGSRGLRTRWYSRASPRLLQGKCAEAEPLFQRTMAINEKTLGPDHPSTARTLGGLPDLFRAQVRVIALCCCLLLHDVGESRGESRNLFGGVCCEIVFSQDTVVGLITIAGDYLLLLRNRRVFGGLHVPHCRVDIPTLRRNPEAQKTGFTMAATCFENILWTAQTTITT